MIPHRIRLSVNRPALRRLVLGAALIWAAGPLQAKLADQPISAIGFQPANVLLSLSVEWPTGNVQAYNDEVNGTGCIGRINSRSVCYFEPAERAARINAANAANPAYTPVLSMPYLGYFDPYQCYEYQDLADTVNDHFKPTRYADGFDMTRRHDSQPAGSTARCPGSGEWSGNFLNWATMQTIDIFRWTMTGGDRQADDVDFTVLEKARHDGQGGTAQFPIKHVGLEFSNGLGTVPMVLPSDVAGVATDTAELFIEISGRNTMMRVSSSADLSNPVDYYVRARVCDSAHPETVTTCAIYGESPNLSHKPIGLIQENADVVRFGAFGYLLDNSNLRDGGVMRARMKFVGPTRPVLDTETSVANDAAEWLDADGRFVANPDPVDAAATAGVTQSGVIRYLNRFGRLNGYKSIDPVSELYYEGLRYFKNIGPTPEYSTLTGNAAAQAKMIDGFPIITDWDDPIEPPPGFSAATEWCPKNFVIGISDTNTHKDKRLPGNTSVVNESAAEPSNPDGSLNVSTLLNEIVAAELANEGVALLRSNGQPLTPGEANCCNGSAYLASLAYYAHTRDIRPDDATKIHTKGKQTLRTFYIDVREAGSWGTGVSRTAPQRRTQLWLAAKFGGFDDRDKDGQLTAADATADLNGDGVIDVLDAWDQDGDDLPDTYFEASSAEAMVNGLRTAFAAIRLEIATNAAVGVAGSKSQLQTDTGLYQSNYDPTYWSGDIEAYEYQGINDSTGDVNITPVWSAAERIAAQNWNGQRRIVTMERDAKVRAADAPAPEAIAFRWAQLTAWQKTQLEEQAVLQYLRGRQDDARFRVRLRSGGEGQPQVPAVLGDVVDSSPRYVGAPSSRLSDLYNPGYADFIIDKKDRIPMIYVGANDGMLHAIDGRVDHSDGGKEIWAYVPSALFAGITAPEVDGLLALSKRNYLHRYYVNATPTIGDVDFKNTSTDTSGGDWRTLLVGGLGKGGRAFYALDVTDGASVNNEVEAAGNVLWEFEDPDMGYSYGKPQIVKTRRWGWVVLLTSGYENIPATGSTGDGLPFLYVVDAKTGALLQKIAISGSGGTVDHPAGLAEVTAYAPNGADGTITEVYGGDMLGNLWRFDFTSDSADVPAPILMAKLKDSTNQAQPITTGPIVRIAPVSRKRYVFVGTGRYLDVSDAFDFSSQSFYALIDGTRNLAFADDSTELATPYTRARLVANSDLLTGVSVPADKYGWYHDLSDTGERIVVDPQDTDVGKISWLGSIPNSLGLCTGEGSSHVYVTSFETGQSQLVKDTATGPERIASVDPGTTGVGLQLVRVGNNIRALVTGSRKSLKVTQGYLQYQRPRTLNWREITDPAD